MNLFVATVQLYFLPFLPCDHPLILLISFFLFWFWLKETLMETLYSELVALSFSMLASFTIVLSSVLAYSDSLPAPGG